MIKLVIKLTFILYTCLFLYTSAWATWLYQSASGPVGYVGHALAIKATMGIGYNSKIMVGDGDGDIYLYASGTWTKKADGGESSGICLLFVDSNENVFASWFDSQGLWKSGDDGANWTKVMDSTEMPTATDEIRSMAEDDEGNLYAAGYAGTDILFKSTDDGANWSATHDTWSGGAYPNHVHYIYWCPYRDVLFVAGGDSGAGSDVHYSSDNGANWTAWTDTSQTVAITSDASYIYGSLDMTNKFGNIWRGVFTAGSPVSVAEVYTPNGANGAWAWWGDVDVDGNIIFVIGNGAAGQNAQIVYSADQGDNWTIAKDYGAYNLGPMRFALPSYYYASADTYYYGGGSTGDLYYFSAYRFYANNVTFKVGGGTDYIKDGTTDAWASLEGINTIQSAFDTSVTVQLQANLTGDPLLAIADSLTWDGNTKTVTGAVTDSPEWTENLDGGSTNFNITTTSNVTITEQSAEQAHSGSNSCKFDSDGGGTTNGFRGRNGAVSISSGTYWASGWVYIDSTTGLTSTTRLMKVYGSSANEIRVQVTSARIPYVYTTGLAASAENIYESKLVGTVIPEDTWTQLKLRVYIHDTLGEITLWMNDAIVINAVGLDTLDTGQVFAKVAWGMYTTQDDALVYWDDMAVADSDPDQPSAIDVIADSVVLTKFNQVQGIRVQGAGCDLRTSIINGPTDGLTIASGATTGEFYNLTIYGATDDGIVANESCTIKNCVVNSSTGDDIEIASGKTVTGDFNHFDDASAAGAGTYTDGGDTIFSGGSPVFVNAGTDFDLQVTSPLIAAGTDVSLTEDFDSIAIIGAFDIGAYEYQALMPAKVYYYTYH